MNDFFEEMTLQYEKRLYAQAMKRLRDSMDAQDAVQETFLKAWIHIEKLRDCEYLGAWLMRVLINECISMQRRKQSHQKLVCTVAEKEPAAQPAFEEGSVLQIDVMEAVSHLDEVKQLLFKSCLLGGLNIAHLAQLTGYSRPAVYAQMNRGREKLKQMMAG